MVLSFRCVQYMSTLEQQLQAFNSDNDRLRLENTTLKRRVALLQSEVTINVLLPVVVALKNSVCCQLLIVILHLAICFAWTGKLNIFILFLDFDKFVERAIKAEPAGVKDDRNCSTVCRVCHVSQLSAFHVSTLNYSLTPLFSHVYICLKRCMPIAELLLVPWLF